MKKRIITGITALALMFALTACGGQAEPSTEPLSTPATEASEPPIADVAETQKPEAATEPIPASDYAMNTYTFVQTTVDGYEIEQTLNIGSWIRASDTQMLDSAWAAVGGTEETPTAGAFIDYVGLEDFRSDRSVIAYGTLSLRNVTEGFDITTEYPLSTLVSMKRTSNPFGETASLGMWSVVMDFSGERKVQGRESGDSNLDEAYFYADMISNNWGTLPIAMATSNVFNPNNPDGNPLLGEVEFSLGTEQFYIQPIWNASTGQTGQAAPDDTAVNASQTSVSGFIGRWIGDDGSELEFRDDGSAVWAYQDMTFELTYYIEGNQFSFPDKSIYGSLENDQLTLTDQNGLVSSAGTVVFQRMDGAPASSAPGETAAPTDGAAMDVSNFSIIGVWKQTYGIAAWESSNGRVVQFTDDNQSNIFSPKDTYGISNVGDGGFSISVTGLLGGNLEYWVKVIDNGHIEVYESDKTTLAFDFLRME